MTAPWGYLRYLGTDGLSSKHEGEGSLYEACDGVGGRFAKLGLLYSRFRPEDKTAVRRPRPRGYGPSSVVESAGEGYDEVAKIEHHFNLDSHELFGQLQTVVSLAKLGPVRGVSLSLVTISEAKTFRVFRAWLAERARDGATQHPSHSLKDQKPIAEDPTIAWVDAHKSVGLRVRVRERQWQRAGPILIAADEDRPVSYSFEIEGVLLFLYTLTLINCS
ncbi:MAG: hypothetical protein Q9227_007857 [Pyrenula ochraceoflavens]